MRFAGMAETTLLLHSQTKTFCISIMPRFRLFSFRHPHPIAQANGNPDGRTALLSKRQVSASNPMPVPDTYELPPESNKNKSGSGAYITPAQQNSPALKTCHNVLELIASPASPTDGYSTVNSVCLTRPCDDLFAEAHHRAGLFPQPDAIALHEPDESTRRPRKLLPKLHKLSKLQPSCNSPGHANSFQSPDFSDILSNRPPATNRSRAMSFGRSAFTSDPTTQSTSPASLQRSQTTLPLQQDSASKSLASYAHLTCPRFNSQDALSAAHPEFNGFVGSQTHIVQAVSRQSQGNEYEECAPKSPSISSQATPGAHLNSQAPCSSSESHHSSSLRSYGRSSAECFGPLQYPSSEDASDSEFSTEAFSPHERDMLKIMARYGKSMSKPAVSPHLTHVGLDPRAVLIPTGALGGEGTEKCSRVRASQTAAVAFIISSSESVHAPRDCDHSENQLWCSGDGWIDVHAWLANQTDNNSTGTTILSHRSIKRAFASSPDLKQLSKTKSARKKDEHAEGRCESPLGIKSRDPRLERFEALLRASDASTGGTIKLSLTPNMDPSCQLPPSLPRLRLSHNFFRSSATPENDSEIIEPICPAQL